MPYGLPRGDSGASELGAEIGKALTSQTAYQNVCPASNDFTNGQWSHNGTITANKIVGGKAGQFPASAVGANAWWELIGSGANPDDNVSQQLDPDSAIRLCAAPVFSVYVMAGDSDVAAVEYEFNGTRLWRLRFNPLNGQIIEFVDPLGTSPSPIVDTFILGSNNSDGQQVVYRFTFQGGQDDPYLNGEVRLIPSDTGSVGTTTYFQCVLAAAFYDTTGNLITEAFADNPAWIDTQDVNTSDEYSSPATFAAAPRYQTTSPLLPRLLPSGGGGLRSYTIDYDADFGRLILGESADGTSWTVTFPDAFYNVSGNVSSKIPRGWFCYVGVKDAFNGDPIELVWPGQTQFIQPGNIPGGFVGGSGFFVPNTGDFVSAPSGLVMLVYLGTDTFTGGIWLCVNCAGIVVEGQVVFNPFQVAGLPANAVLGGNIFVTDESGGPVPAWFDGTNWRRYSDGAIVT